MDLEGMVGATQVALTMVGLARIGATSPAGDDAGRPCPAMKMASVSR